MLPELGFVDTLASSGREPRRRASSLLRESVRGHAEPAHRLRADPDRHHRRARVRRCRAAKASGCSIRRSSCSRSSPPATTSSSTPWPARRRRLAARWARSRSPASPPRRGARRSPARAADRSAGANSTAHRRRPARRPRAYVAFRASTELTLRLNRIKSGYTDGARSLARRAVRGLADSRVTPNQLTALGFALNVVAAVLIYQELWIAAGLVFLVGSIIDILDGALARSRGQASPRGAFIDSTFDRISEGFVLGAIALVFARDGDDLARRGRLRRARRLVPDLVHPRARRGPRPRRQGRPDGPRRARRAARPPCCSRRPGARCRTASRCSPSSRRSRSPSARTPSSSRSTQPVKRGAV